MVASRNRGGFKLRFRLGVLLWLLLPGEIGYQDLAALIARQPQSVDRVHKGALASTFGTIHEAKLTLPQPVGTFIAPSTGLHGWFGVDPGGALGPVGIVGVPRPEELGTFQPA